MQTRLDRLRTALERRFQPSLLEIEDQSARHAGHAGARGEGETHYAVLLVSPLFQGESRVARSRAVHEVLDAEFKSGLHALALTLRTPDEQAALTRKG